MARNYAVRVYLNKEQEELVKRYMVEEGYKSLSAFLRDLALNKNTLFKEKFFEMYKKVMKDE